jgi:uncharacterized protein
VSSVNIARECGVDAKMVKEYCRILCDTLLGRLIPPYQRRQERQVMVKAAKFYLFDVGVAGVLTRRYIAEEHRGVAIEVTGSSRVEDRNLRPLAAFQAEQKPRKAFLVCHEIAERPVEKIRIMPWRIFLRELWSGDAIR